MRILRHPFVKSGSVWLLPAITLLLAACSTTPKVDWDARIGTYTYDMAVAELGRPDRTTDLPGGAVTVEWIRQRGRAVQSAGLAITRYEPEEGPGRNPGGTIPDQTFQLTFAPDGKLLDWNRNY